MRAQNVNPRSRRTAGDRSIYGWSLTDSIGFGFNCSIDVRLLRDASLGSHLAPNDCHERFADICKWVRPKIMVGQVLCQTYDYAMLG